MIKHLACIMDGNRRWAKKAGLLLTGGIKDGMNNINTAVAFCLKKGIPYLSLYAFSIENLQRSSFERDCCFNLILENGDQQAKEMKEQQVRVRFVGDRSLFPPHVIDMIDYIEQTTAKGSRLTLNLLFCYGGRQEILAGIHLILAKIKSGELSEAALNEETFKEHLWLGNIPDPDLIIRTGFAKRLSNFLPYQATYSELYFVDCLWPELKEKDLDEALQHLTECKRNFGK